MTSSNVHRNALEAKRTGSLAFRLIATALFAVVAFAITGCSGSFDPKLSGGETTSSTTGATFTGRLHGGQQPIANAYIFVFQVGEAGYPGAGVSGNTSIISATTPGGFNGTVNGNSYGPYVLTDSNGNFTFTLSSCTTGDGVYVVSYQGQPITGQTNVAASEMAAVGICPATGVTGLLQNTPFVNVTEVSTVAFAYAMGGFTAAGYDFSHISTSATNITAMQNAFTLAQQLFSVSTTGGANTTSATLVGATFDSGKINLMANVLADCINSAGNTGSSSACYTLFQNATSNGSMGSGVIPGDTASAMINITHNVESNASTILNLANNNYAPYTPTATVNTADLSLSITYPISSYGNFNPLEIRVDSQGYAYALSNYTTQSQATPVVTKISPTSGIVGTATLSGASGTTYHEAIDQSNNVFFLNTSSNSVYEYASSASATLGTQVSGSPFNFSSVISSVDGGNYLTTQEFIVGPYNNLEINDRSTNNVINIPLSNGTYSASSALVVGTDYNANSTYAIAENGAGTSFLNNANGYIESYTTGGSSTRYGSTRSTNIALDNQGNIYGPCNNCNNMTYVITATGAVSTITTGGLNSPQEIVDDGLSNVWVVDRGACAVPRFLNGVAVYSSWLYVIGCNVLSSLAIDPAGNLWFANNANSSTPGSVIEVLGVAAPTTAPLSALSAKILPSNTSATDLRP